MLFLIICTYNRDKHIYNVLRSIAINYSYIKIQIRIFTQNIIFVFLPVPKCAFRNCAFLNIENLKTLLFKLPQKNIFLLFWGSLEWLCYRCKRKILDGL